ncbi:uncharacterized protein RCO7_04009 [Rhynchosporium graminicola]|uniref:C2H2-type domain-containing protein n=1 Tax=Rhynchosporium graminicola TaxID=2792576 RepID=A0A1E1LQ41_9HELO|nr:uncharacterized protein RCO7_04009 [Rhynchosporium commune]
MSAYCNQCDLANEMEEEMEQHAFSGLSNPTLGFEDAEEQLLAHSTYAIGWSDSSLPDLLQKDCSAFALSDHGLADLYTTLNGFGNPSSAFYGLSDSLELPPPEEPCADFCLDVELGVTLQPSVPPFNLQQGNQGPAIDYGHPALPNNGMNVDLGFDLGRFTDLPPSPDVSNGYNGCAIDQGYKGLQGNYPDLNVDVGLGQTVQSAVSPHLPYHVSRDSAIEYGLQGHQALEMHDMSFNRGYEPPSFGAPDLEDFRQQLQSSFFPLAGLALPNEPISGEDVSTFSHAAPIQMLPVQVSGHFSCTQCMTTFKRDSDRIRHESSIHGTNRLLIICHIQGCNKSQGWGYTRQDKLVEHLWKKHANLGYLKRT